MKMRIMVHGWHDKSANHGVRYDIVTGSAGSRTRAIYGYVANYPQSGVSPRPSDLPNFPDPIKYSSTRRLGNNS